MGIFRKVETDEEPQGGGKNLVVMAACALTITITSLGVSLWLYRDSGTAQLDLSRPGYIREENKSDEVEQKEFSAIGTVDKDVVREFEEIYRQRMDVIFDIDPFKDSALNDEALGIDE